MSIELRNVTKEFGEVMAVDHVNFSVKEGELVGLLGPSGGGKTTVLRMIAGLEAPTDGEIYIRGKQVNDLSVQQRNIHFKAADWIRIPIGRPGPETARALVH